MHGTETITAKEIADLLSVTVQALNRRAVRDSWPCEIMNGRGDRCFPVDQLPPEIQERIRRYRLGIDQDSVEDMASRCELVIDLAQLKNPASSAEIKMVCECLAVPRARGRDARIREIAEGHGYTRSTAYRLMARAKTGQTLKKTTRQYGHTFGDLGITVRAWDPEAARIAIEAVAGNRHNRVEGQSIYIRIAEECDRLKLRCGSLRSFYQLQAKIDPSLLKYRDAGSRGLREDIIPSIRRDFAAYRAMECLIGDQHKADYYALDSAGQVVTLELFHWMDFRTQLVWGSIAYKHYNRYTVGSALLNAVRWGIPGMVYTDWGKPEESDYVSHLIEQLAGLGVKAEPIRHVNAIARNPQAKPIEGWHSWLDKKFRNEGIPGYCKRLADGRENELQQKEIAEQIRAGALLSIPDLTARLFQVSENWNNHIFKNRGVDTGKSPLQVYREETQIHPVTVLSPDVLEYIFLPVERSHQKKPTVVKRSQVKVHHPWLGILPYYSPDLSGRQGEQVEVRFDPFDKSRVWIFSAGGKKLLCQAEEWGVINPKVRDQVSKKIGIQRALEKQVRELHRAYAPPEERSRVQGPGSIGQEVDPETGEVISRGDAPSFAKASEGRGQVRKIHPAERQARELRVMRTPLDDEQPEKVRARAGYRPLVFEKKEEPQRIRRVMRIDWDKPNEGEDEE